MTKMYCDSVIYFNFNYCDCCHRLRLNFVSEFYFNQSHFWHPVSFEKPAYPPPTSDSQRILSNVQIIPFTNIVLCVMAWIRFSFVNWFTSLEKKIRLSRTKSGVQLYMRLPQRIFKYVSRHGMCWQVYVFGPNSLASVYVATENALFP